MKTICFVLLPFCLTLAVSYADGQREQTGQSDLVLTRLRVPQDFPTIQAAIDAAHHGDTVVVSEGTYYENIRSRGKAITVGSLYVIDGDTTHTPARTTSSGAIRACAVRGRSWSRCKVWCGWKPARRPAVGFGWPCRAARRRARPR